MKSFKTPDRINCTSKAKNIIETIDQTSFLGLGKNEFSRSKLFMFAMALGIEAGTSLPLQNSEGLVLDGAIDDQTHALMHAFFLSSLDEPEIQLDEITHKAKVYTLAEEYANAGFEILDDYMQNNTEDRVILQLFEEIDESYQQLLG